MSAQTMAPWMDERLAADERSDLLLGKLSLDEKMAQVSCYFPTDITQTADFPERFPYGVGEVSCLET